MSAFLRVDASRVHARLGAILKHLSFEEPLHGTANLLQDRIVKKAPEAFGILKRSIKKKSLGKNKVAVFTDDPKAPAVEFGSSGPKFLPFFKGGNKQPIWYWATLKGLQIEGRKGMTVSGRPQKFFFNTLTENMGAIKAIFKDYFNKILRLTE